MKFKFGGLVLCFFLLISLVSYAYTKPLPYVFTKAISTSSSDYVSMGTVSIPGSLYGSALTVEIFYNSGDGSVYGTHSLTIAGSGPSNVTFMYDGMIEVHPYFVYTSGVTIYYFGTGGTGSFTLPDGYHYP